MIKKRTLSAQSGFTLVEVMIIVAIVAVVLGAYLSFYKPAQDSNETIETKQKIDRVLNALSNYALSTANNQLPCPGDPRATGGGLGTADSSTTTCPSPAGQGIIPYRELGLSQEDAKDGFGNYMTYIVWQQATSGVIAADLNASMFCNGTTSTIALFRNGVAQPAADRPFVAIISHGPNGVGSFNMNNTNSGQRNNPYGDMSGVGGASATEGERGNVVTPNPTSTAGRLDINDYNPVNGANHFDDIVGMMTGPQVVTRLSMTGCH